MKSSKLQKYRTGCDSRSEHLISIFPLLKSCAVAAILFVCIKRARRVQNVSLTSLKLSLPSKSSSTSLIMFLRPRWVCGAPSFSIISFSSIKSMKPSLPVSYLKKTNQYLLFRVFSVLCAVFLICDGKKYICGLLVNRMIKKVRNIFHQQIYTDHTSLWLKSLDKTFRRLPFGPYYYNFTQYCVFCYWQFSVTSTPTGGETSVL